MKGLGGYHEASQNKHWPFSSELFGNQILLFDATLAKNALLLGSCGKQLEVPFLLLYPNKVASNPGAGVCLFHTLINKGFFWRHGSLKIFINNKNVKKTLKIKKTKN